MAHHELKCWTDYFEAIFDGRKNFEVRRNDRGFQAGDTLSLLEYNPSGDHERCGDAHCRTKRYSGRTLKFSIGYVLSHGHMWPLGDLVVLSLLPLHDDE